MRAPWPALPRALILGLPGLWAVLAAPTALASGECRPGEVEERLVEALGGAARAEVTSSGILAVRLDRPLGQPGPAGYATMAQGAQLSSALRSEAEGEAALRETLERVEADPAFRAAVAACTAPGAFVGSLGPAVEAALAPDEEAPLVFSPDISGSWSHRLLYALLPWLWAVLTLALLAGAWWGRRRLERWDLLALGAATLLGLLLRTLVAESGPGDVDNAIASELTRREAADGFGFYGQAVTALLWLLDDLGLPPTEALMMRVSLWAGVLTVPASYGLALALRRPRLEAALVAAMMALAPLHVAFSPVYHRYVIFGFLMVCTLALLALAARHDAREHGGRWWQVPAAIAAGSLALQCRPESVALVGVMLGLLVVLWFGGSRSKGSVMAILAGVALLSVAPLASTLGESLGSAPIQDAYVAGQRPIFDPDHNVWLNPELTPLPWALLSVVGLAAAPKGQRLLVSWLVVCALGWTWLVATQMATVDRLIYARHQIGALPFYVLLAGMGLGRVLHLLPRAWAAVVTALVLVSAAWPIAVATGPSTLRQEYRFWEQALPLIPADCALVAYETPGDSGLRRPTRLGYEQGLPFEAWIRNGQVPESPACVAYVHTSHCAATTLETDEERALQRRSCATREAPGFVPLLEGSLLNRPSAGPQYGGVETLEVGLYLRH